MGDNIRLNVHLQNKENLVLPSPMAIIGIPAGASLQPWQLKKLQEEKAFDYYEIKDNYLVLYYSELKANADIKIAFDLKTELKGKFEAPANSTYLYYAEEYIYWSAGQKIAIQ